MAAETRRSLCRRLQLDACHLLRDDFLTNQKTLARIEDAAQVEPLGAVALKGLAHPVPVFNVTAFKA